MGHAWKYPDDLADRRGWTGEPSALVGWARWTVDSLYYLADLDLRVEVRDANGQHAWHVVDLAHFRWAASSALGAMDLCAAAAARRAGLGPKVTRGGVREFSLLELGQAVADGELANPDISAWVSRLAVDRSVGVIRAIRHPTTHARLRRHFQRGGSGTERTHLVLEDLCSDPVEIGEFVVMARDTAGRAVDDFLDQIASGLI